MIEPLEAALEIHNFLTQKNISYAIIGGFAVQYWGEPRFTRDIDITVLLPTNETEEFVRQVTEHFMPRVSNPLKFAKENRMLLIKAANGYEIDISLGIPGYEKEVIKRAIGYELKPGRKIRLCSAEDLIIHKAVAGRPRDLEDIEGIIYRQGNKLDVSYIKYWLNEFALALENPDLPKGFEKLWKNFKES